MVRNHTNQDFFDHEEITITRTCLKNHSRNLHVPLCGRFCRKFFSNTLWFVTGKKDLVKMWFDISGADIIQSYLIEKIQERSMRQSKRTERVSPDGMYCCRT